MNAKLFPTLSILCAAVAVGAYFAGSARVAEPERLAAPSKGVRPTTKYNSGTVAAKGPERLRPNSAGAPRRVAREAEDLKSLRREVTDLLAKDVEAATMLVASIKDEATRKSMQGLIVVHYASTDLDAAIAYLENVSEGTSGWRSGYRSVIDELLSQRGPGALQEWVEGLEISDGPERRARGGFKEFVTRQAVQRIATEDPERARALIIPYADRGWFSDVTLVFAAQNTGFNVREQLDWVACLPGMPSQRRGAIGKMFSKWLAADFFAAGDWLAGQELEPIHDDAISDFAINAAEWDPATAREWAAQINDEELQARVLSRLAPD